MAAITRGHRLNSTLKRPLRRDLNVGGIRVARGRFQALQPQTLQVKLDGLAHIAFHFFSCASGRNAAIQIR